MTHLLRVVLILVAILGGHHRVFHNVQASMNGHNYLATCVERRLRHPRRTPDFTQRYGRGVCWFGSSTFVRLDALTADGAEIVGVTLHR